jgi:hypothetical protein
MDMTRIIIGKESLRFQNLLIYNFAHNGLLFSWNINRIGISMTAATMSMRVRALVFHRVDLIHLFELLSLFAVEKFNDFANVEELRAKECFHAFQVLRRDFAGFFLTHDFDYYF